MRLDSLPLPRKSKYVKDWYVMKNKHGIISITFHTTKRWIPFSQWDDNLYEIGEWDEENDNINDIIQEVPVFLDESKTYVSSSYQEKDHITFYFIPIKFLSDKTKNIIIEGKN